MRVRRPRDLDPAAHGHDQRRRVGVDRGRLLRINPKLHIYALDQRGAGATDLPERAACRSSPNSCMTQADLAADLLAFMDAQKIAKATLVGHAMVPRRPAPSRSSTPNASPG